MAAVGCNRLKSNRPARPTNRHEPGHQVQEQGVEVAGQVCRIRYTWAVERPCRWTNHYETQLEPRPLNRINPYLPSSTADSRSVVEKERNITSQFRGKLGPIRPCSSRVASPCSRPKVLQPHRWILHQVPAATGMRLTNRNLAPPRTSARRRSNSTALYTRFSRPSGILSILPDPEVEPAYGDGSHLEPLSNLWQSSCICPLESSLKKNTVI